MSDTPVPSNFSDLLRELSVLSKKDLIEKLRDRDEGYRLLKPAPRCACDFNRLPLSPRASAKDGYWYWCKICRKGKSVRLNSFCLNESLVDIACIVYLFAHDSQICDATKLINVSKSAMIKYYKQLRR